MNSLTWFLGNFYIYNYLCICVKVLKLIKRGVTEGGRKVDEQGCRREVGGRRKKEGR